MRDVILVFSSFHDRDTWVACLQDQVRWIYKNEPWLAASVSETDYTTLSHIVGIQVFPDTRLAPMNQMGVPR